ncbi:3D-(3,5/4)-trihydroxycyclohexane-1,2-dione hydrolase, partial [Lacticaseibacillus paracasei subsp. paracasei Lpp123]
MTATELNAQVAADAKKETIRLTTAQALVRFLNQQYIDVDGQVTSFVEGLLPSLVMVMSWAWAR